MCTFHTRTLGHTETDIHIWFQRSRHKLPALKFRGINQHFETFTHTHTQRFHISWSTKWGKLFEAPSAYERFRSISACLRVKTQQFIKPIVVFTEVLRNRSAPASSSGSSLQDLCNVFRADSHTHVFLDQSYEGTADVRRWMALAFALKQRGGGHSHIITAAAWPSQ